ncbi:hypothetical protein [Pseudomonas brassicacearum]|uniref:Uncharacterized protein n=1 Tax=Pseudomonas brassicacearum TaxID=930166 RepID=A0A423H1Z0_9PSED|nr:hypothetical protein [Pseudomonas brassicacearum]RON06247.1 hypothetical protein BK658_00215 [Pseudomonas brassicacearum]
MPYLVEFHNRAGFASSFSVQWDGGETNRTNVITAGGVEKINLRTCGVPEGTSCWARAYVQGGPNHDSGDNFDYREGDSSIASYSITGTTLNPSFSLDIID